MPHPPQSPRYSFLVRLCAWGAFVWEKIFLDSDLNVKQKRKTLYFSVGGAYFRIYGSVALLEGHISESPLVCQHQPWSVTDSPPLQPLSLYRRHREEDVECDEIESKSHINCSPIVFWGKKCFYFLLCDNLWSLSALCAVVYHSSQSNPTLTLNPPTMNYKNDQFEKL